MNRNLATLLTVFVFFGPLSQAAILTVTTAENFLADGVGVAPGSLLEILQKVKAGDTVRFKIPGEGPHVIDTPVGGYPLITADHVTIDGYSQPGSMPNRDPILGGNHAKIRIVLDSSSDVGQATPLPFSGYGETESAILGVQRADYFTVRGLSFLSRHTADDTDDPTIYGVAFVEAATHGHVKGCWFGLAPDGTTVAGGRSAVAAFRDREGATPLYSSHLVVGTDGDGVNDEEEFNVIIGMGLALALELPNAKIAGNYINVFPDGNTFYDVGALAEEIGMVESIENGRAADNTVIGTDGDGVSDANERNIVAPSVYDHLIEFYDAATNVVIAGNYFGVGVDGTTAYPFPAKGTPDFVFMDGGSSIRIGSNGDGVSDALEGNLIFGVAGNEYVDSALNTTIVSRRNRMVQDSFSAIPFAHGDHARGYQAYYATTLVDPSSGVEPRLLEVTGGRLRGTLPEPKTGTFPYSFVDVSVVDPGALLNGLVHPTSFLTTFVEGSTQDLDPAPNQFVFDLTAFAIPTGTILAIQVTYSETPGRTEAGRALSGVLSEPVAVETEIAGKTPTSPILEMQRSGQKLVFSWSAGQGVFRLDSTPSLRPARWAPVSASATFAGGRNTVSIPAPNSGLGFYRLVFTN